MPAPVPVAEGELFGAASAPATAADGIFGPAPVPPAAAVIGDAAARPLAAGELFEATAPFVGVDAPPNTNFGAIFHTTPPPAVDSPLWTHPVDFGAATASSTDTSSATAAVGAFQTLLASPAHSAVTSAKVFELSVEQIATDIFGACNFGGAPVPATTGILLHQPHLLLVSSIHQRHSLWPTATPLPVNAGGLFLLRHLLQQ
jgi:hypothetical protein